MLDSLKSEKETLMNHFISKQDVSEELKTWMKYEIEMDYYNKLARFPINKARFNELNYETIVPISYYDFMNISFPKEALINSNSTAFIGRYSYGRIKAFSKDYCTESIIGYFIEEKDNIYFGSVADQKIEVILDVTKDEFLREILIAKCLYACIERREIAEFEMHYSLFNEIVHAPFLREPIVNNYIKTKKHLDNPEVGENSVLSSTKDTPANAVIEKIISEHKGQIIYLDIWATWCSPCRKEMPYSKELMNTLNSDKVDFVYLCVDSKEDKWKAIISARL
jgi:thiol-disulfide isomerase/thioredoxin